LIVVIKQGFDRRTQAEPGPRRYRLGLHILQLHS